MCDTSRRRPLWPTDGARVTGKPGVAVVTAGPGVTNAVTGIWNAFECLSPINVFGGKSPMFEFDLGSLQELNSLALVEPTTKWWRYGYETRRIPCIAPKP